MAVKAPVDTAPDAVIAAAVSVPVVVGLADIIKVVPVPVWDAMAVAFPTDVIGPVRFAFVVTVAAFPDIFVWSPVFVPDRFDPVIAPVTPRVPGMVTAPPEAMRRRLDDPRVEDSEITNASASELSIPVSQFVMPEIVYCE